MVEVIAEAGLSHGGNVHVAEQLATAAHKAGADAVKFQTFNTELLLHKGDPSYRQLRMLELSYSDFRRLKKHCDNIGIEFLSTPGDIESLNFLVNDLGVKRIKIGSDDLTNYDLLQAARVKKLSVILSTGMGTLDEINYAAHILRDCPLTVLHCVSVYPCPYDEANLLAIKTLENYFERVGYSDHCPGYSCCVAAAYLGAKVIEKHFELENIPGIDHAVSINDRELKDLIDHIKRIPDVLGTGKKGPSKSEQTSIKQFRKGTDGRRPLLWLG